MDLNRSSLIQQFLATREFSCEMVAPLEQEDYNAQPIEDVSPPKWNLGHTTWFLEQGILAANEPSFRWFNQRYRFCFNSYYEGFGERLARPLRGTLLRPTVQEVFNYRQNVDERMLRLLKNADSATFEQIAPLVQMGIHHERQHQELFFGEIKFIYFTSPIQPAYRENGSRAKTSPCFAPMKFLPLDGGLHLFGYDGEEFCYDHEQPRHKVWLDNFALANRLVTAGEYLEFMLDGGYKDPRHWLSDGWHWVQNENHEAPLYWQERDGQRFIFTLSGERELDPNEPVCHVNYYEAAAYASWAGKRLPTEFELELASAQQKGSMQYGNYAEKQNFHPLPANGNGQGFQQLFGDVWEWSSSPYQLYPGFRPREGVVGEYNGKFACNQMVLRGFSCATPRGYATRVTDRNFWPPPTQWQFTGIRLADRHK